MHNLYGICNFEFETLLLILCITSPSSLGCEGLLEKNNNLRERHDLPDVETKPLIIVLLRGARNHCARRARAMKTLLSRENIEPLYLHKHLLRTLCFRFSRKTKDPEMLRPTFLAKGSRLSSIVSSSH